MDKKLESIIKEIANAPLRSSVITAAAVIVSTLEKLIIEYFIEDAKSLDMFGGNGCLSSLSAKNNMAYAMGLISKELYKDIDSYRNIRNRCAHELCIDEGTENSIRDRIKNFNLLNKAFVMGENEQLVGYMVLEFAVIFIALIKRINNVDKLTEFPFEVHDDYLGFDEKDYNTIKDFSKLIK